MRKMVVIGLVGLMSLSPALGWAASTKACLNTYELEYLSLRRNVENLKSFENMARYGSTGGGILGFGACVISRRSIAGVGVCAAVFGGLAFLGQGYADEIAAEIKRQQDAAVIFKTYSDVKNGKTSDTSYDVRHLFEVLGFKENQEVKDRLIKLMESDEACKRGKPSLQFSEVLTKISIPN